MGDKTAGKSLLSLEKMADRQQLLTEPSLLEGPTRLRGVAGNLQDGVGGASEEYLSRNRRRSACPRRKNLEGVSNEGRRRSPSAKIQGPPATRPLTVAHQKADSKLFTRKTSQEKPTTGRLARRVTTGTETQR